MKNCRAKNPEKQTVTDVEPKNPEKQRVRDVEPKTQRSRE